MQLTFCASLLCRNCVHTRTDARCLAVTFAGANKAAVVSAGVHMHICACNDVSDIFIRNARLDLELAHPATESNGAVSRVACRFALGGTLLSFGVPDSHRVRIRRNDTVSRMHKFAQVGGTKNHGVIQHHERTRLATKSSGVAARPSCKCALGGTLLLFWCSRIPLCAYSVQRYRAAHACVCPGCGNAQQSRYSGAGRHFHSLARTQVLLLLLNLQGFLPLTSRQCAFGKGEYCLFGCKP